MPEFILAPLGQHVVSSPHLTREMHSDFRKLGAGPDATIQGRLIAGIARIVGTGQVLKKKQLIHGTDQNVYRFFVQRSPQCAS